MQVTSYYCDYCEATLSSPHGAKPHLSVKVGSPSGIATIESQVWGIRYHLPSNIYQFCHTRCFKGWIDRKFSGAKEKFDALVD